MERNIPIINGDLIKGLSVEDLLAQSSRVLRKLVTSQDFDLTLEYVSTLRSLHNSLSLTYEFTLTNRVMNAPVVPPSEDYLLVVVRLHIRMMNNFFGKNTQRALTFLETIITIIYQNFDSNEPILDQPESTSQ